MEDQALIAAIMGGGTALEAAMRTLYEEQGVREQVFRFVKGRKGTDEDAEDIFQDGIRNLMMSIRAGKYRGEGSLRGYLYGTCRNLWFRRFDKLSRETDLEERMQEPVLEEDPEILLLDREREQLLAALLNRLGQKCKEVLELWKLGYSMREIAGHLGYKSEGVARKKKHQCLKRLIDLVEKSPEHKRQLGEF